MKVQGVDEKAEKRSKDVRVSGLARPEKSIEVLQPAARMLRI
jgi:hypothetical protein